MGVTLLVHFVVVVVVIVGCCDYYCLISCLFVNVVGKEMLCFSCISSPSSKFLNKDTASY